MVRQQDAVETIPTIVHWCFSLDAHETSLVSFIQTVAALITPGVQRFTIVVENLHDVFACETFCSHLLEQVSHRSPTPLQQLRIRFYFDDSRFADDYLRFLAPLRRYLCVRYSPSRCVLICSDIAVLFGWSRGTSSFF